MTEWQDPRILHMDALGELRDFGESEAAFENMYRPDLRTLHEIFRFLVAALVISIGALITMIFVLLIVDVMEFLIEGYMEAA